MNLQAVECDFLTVDYQWSVCECARTQRLEGISRPRPGKILHASAKVKQFRMSDLFIEQSPEGSWTERHDEQD